MIVVERSCTMAVRRRLGRHPPIHIIAEGGVEIALI